MENNSSSSQFLPKLTGVTNMLLFFYFILATEASIATTSVSEKVSSNKAHVQLYRRGIVIVYGDGIGILSEIRPKIRKSMDMDNKYVV